MKVTFAASFPKDPLFPSQNEDIFIGPRNGRIALSDGAAESFDSRTWANLLVSRFIEDPRLDNHWLNETIIQYRLLFNLDSLSWSQRMAYDRGSFATLLGVERSIGSENVEILAVGDSIAVLLDGTEFVNSFPYSSADQFPLRPELFSTIHEFNQFVTDSQFFLTHHITWNLERIASPIVLCMTDALGKWALEKADHDTSVWKELVTIGSLLSFDDFVTAERKARRLRLDDTTLVQLSFEVEGLNDFPIT